MDFLNQQFNQSNRQQQPRSLWEQSLRFRYGLLAGLIVGILIGWFFHGVVSLVIRLGVLALLLIPFLIALWFWFRLRRPRQPEDQGRTRVFTIGNVPEFMRGNQPYEPPPPATTPREPVIDLNDEDYDLEAFKKRLEQDR